LINRIKTEVKIQFSGDEILLSTAHKAKGIEFESVILTDDYTDLKITKDVFGRETYPSIEEINILYVALTRAATNLQMNNSLIDWLKENKHYNGLVLN
jgi:F-box protein 18 (helicase)